MARAILFSVMLTVAAGPSAALLCVSLCAPQEAAAAVCHELDVPVATTSVTGVHGCDDPGEALAALVPDGSRRTAEPPALAGAVPVFSHHAPLLASLDGFGHWATPQPARAKRPLVTALRI
jgi:hypothetical protein